MRLKVCLDFFGVESNREVVRNRNARAQRFAFGAELGRGFGPFQQAQEGLLAGRVALEALLELSEVGAEGVLIAEHRLRDQAAQVFQIRGGNGVEGRRLSWRDLARVHSKRVALSQILPDNVNSGRVDVKNFSC